MTATKVLHRTNEKEKHSYIKTAAMFALCTAGGFLASLAGINERFSPFGVAFAACVPEKYMLFATAGSVAGWFFTFGSVTALRYSSSVLALCVIMFALKAFKNVRSHPATPVITSFVCMLATGLAVVFASKPELPDMLICFSEACISGASAYLFTKSRDAISFKGGLSTMTSKEATAVILSLTVFMMSLKFLTVGSFVPVRVPACVLILLCAYYSREAGGAVVGVCSGAAMSLGSGSVLLLAFYAVGGLLSGVFSSMGKWACAASFILSGVAVGAIVGINEQTAAVLIEAAVSSLIFVIISLKFNSKLENLLAPGVVSPAIESVRTDIVRRLKNASEASAEICKSLNNVNDALVRADRRGIDDVFRKTRERVCGSCGLYDACWSEAFDISQDCFNTLLMLKKENVFLEYKTVPQHFASRCIRTESVCDSFNKMYLEHKARERVEARVREIYSLASDQFVNVSSLLDSLCGRVGEQVCFDMDTAAKARAAAVSCGYDVVDACCVIDSCDRIRLELHVKNSAAEENGVQRSVHTRLETLCGKKLDFPAVSDCGDEKLLVFCERPRYRIISSACRSCSNGEKHSGDSFTTFRDGDGYFYGIICDGMGTGARAAVSSGLAVTLLEKLIKAGFGMKAAIDTVNSSLISHSGEECSVTLDLVAVDLFTGGVEFYKCGASESFIRKNNRVITVGEPSMPMGILSVADSAWCSGTVSGGDMILMCSDGVRDDDKAFVRSELKSFGGGSVREFTSQLCELVRRYQPEKNDDMTVLTLAVVQND